MRGRPKISVVIPVYNAAPFLRECLDSALGQSLSDLELVCVNDGSTDESADLLHQYQARDGRVRVTSQLHSGAGLARNRGIALAVGDFVAFLDADDLYPSADVLLRMYDAAMANDVAVCGGALVTLRDGVMTTAAIKAGPYRLEPFKDTLVRYAEYQVDYGFTLFIYRRSLFREHGIRFPPYSRFQDPPFFVRALILADTFFAMSMPTYCYRRGHTTVAWTGAQTEDVLRGLTDNLRQSRDAGLARLHRLTAWRLRSEYAPQIARHLAPNGGRLRELLKTANDAIDTRLLAGAGDG